MIPKQKTFKTQDVLAIAFAAYRKNKGYIKDSYRFTENDPLFSNKDIVKYQLCPEYRPGDFQVLHTTEEDYEAVDVALKHFRRYSMELLGTGLTDFQKTIFEKVSLDETEYRSLGVLAYVPELVEREVRENTLKKKLRVEYRDSSYLGEEGESVEGVCLILDSYYSSHYEKYSYTADYIGNIITFWNKFEIPVGERRKFKARIKEQTKHRLFAVNATVLNYVKVYKV